MDQTLAQACKKQPKRRRRFPLWLAAVILMTLAVTGSFAYFAVVSPSILNKVSFGTVSVAIDEPGIDPNKVGWGESTKPVQLRNEGSADVVVRALLVPVLETNGTVKPCEFAAMSQPVNGVMTLGDVKLHFASDWAEHWFYKDGMFYYKSVLQPGESTTHLLAGVTLTDMNATPTYQNLQIKVLADALQAEGGAAQDAWGIRVDTTTGAVTE